MDLGEHDEDRSASGSRRMSERKKEEEQGRRE